MAEEGNIRLTLAQSTPGTFGYRQPADGAPNVLMIVLDDLGFAQLGAFGSDIATPFMDGLAQGGLRYNRFHVTAVCSSTRACLLTGRNHHAVGMGMLPDLGMGFPGYSGRLPRSAATLARVLRDAGWSTRAVGKWHLTPRGERSTAGPFDRWPLGVGFEQFYGFIGGATNQWTPNLVRDNASLEQPRSPEAGYHLTEDLADQAIRYLVDLDNAAPQKPFFLYFATGATHSPHQAPDEWIEPYEGRFEDGWDIWRERTFARQLDEGVAPKGTTLTPRPSWVQEWAQLSRVEKQVYARGQEVFSGFLSHTDAQIGRIINFLGEIGRLENTIVMVMSDNGASAEGGVTGTSHEGVLSGSGSPPVQTLVPRLEGWGGMRTYSNYSWGWAWAGNTPLRLWKRFAWLGGTRTPLIVHWPAGIRTPGEVRTQFLHAIDLMPTILDLCNVEAPDEVDGATQQPIDGVSARRTFSDPQAPDPRNLQYFEMIGSRSIFCDGWKATTDHVPSGFADEQRLLEGSRDFASDRWMLFRLSEDFSEAHDLSDEEPNIVERLKETWFLEAGRNQVLPLEDSFMARFGALIPLPYPPGSRRTFRPGGNAIPFESLPQLAGGFRLLADVDVPEGNTEGVLCAIGDWICGMALYVHDGQVIFALSQNGETHRVAATEELTPGGHLIGCSWTPDNPTGGTVSLFEDYKPLGEGVIGVPFPFMWPPGEGGLRIGSDRDFPVSEDYQPPFEWTGALRRVVIDAAPLNARPLVEDLEVALHQD